MKKNRSGAVLIMVLIFMTVLGAVSALMVADLLASTSRVRERLMRDKARDAAESGIALALCRLAETRDYAGEERDFDGGCHFRVTVSRKDGKVEIASVGHVPWRGGRLAYSAVPVTIKQP